MRNRPRSRRPFLLTAALALVVLYPSWSIISIFAQSNRLAKQYNKARETDLVNIAQETKLFIQNNEIQQLKDRLESDFGFNRFSAIEIVGPEGETVVAIDPGRILPSLSFTRRSHILYADDTTYLEFDTQGYRVRVASLDLTEVAFWKTLETDKYLILRDVVIVLFMVGFVFSYFTRDIAVLILAVRSGNWRALKDVRSRSGEGETLLKSMETMNLSLAELEAQNRQLRNQVLPALNSELTSGREPPYEFDCTLARVDVNNFSHIFSTYPVEDFMGVINLFFEEVTEIVSRYRGYVYEFVGDEVIFYFKDEEQENSAAIALAALRDINDAAVRIDARVAREHGYNFRVKSALAHGRLRFGPQVTGFSLAGGILIETVRILAQISEKENNVIYYDADIARRASHLVESRSQKTVTLKGLVRRRHLHSYVTHMGLKDAFAQLRPEIADHLNSFRMDHHLVSILDFMRENARAVDIKLFLCICRRLRDFKVPRAAPELIQSYRRLLDSLLHNCESADRGEHDLFRLSSCLSLGMHLLDAEAFDSHLRPVFKTCLAFGDRRVVANSLAVFSAFASLDEDVIFAKLLTSKDNRVVANALVKEGLKGLRRPIVKQIARMLNSPDPLWIASSLYVIGELAKFHRARNPVHYETQSGFQTLVTQVRQFIVNSNEMIRRQALIAARKTKDRATREAIEAYYFDSADANVKTEIERFFLKPETDAAATPDKATGNRRNDAGSTAA